MIDAEHWHDCEDGTAWWVTDSNVAFIDYTGADRPCGGCDGRKWCLGNDTPGLYDAIACPDCNGTGRHTFDVEVGCSVRCSPADHLFQGGATCSVCNGSSMLTYRVSVEPGMVLPIVNYGEHNIVGRYIVTNVESDSFYMMQNETFPVTSELITLPSAASPGQYAVKVRIIDEGDV